MPRQSDPPSKVSYDLSSVFTRSVWGESLPDPYKQSVDLLDSIREILRLHPSQCEYQKTLKMMNEIPISYHRKTAFLDILHSMMFRPPFRHVEKGMELLCQGVQYKYLTQKES